MRKRPVRNIIFEATTRCNLACAHCYNIWKVPGKSAPPPVDYQTSRRTLRQLCKQAKVGRITMSGGEPLLSDRFLELVLFCRMRKCAVSVISNGVAGSFEDYRALFDLGVDLFEFPVNSRRSEIHDALAGYPGAWGKVTARVGELVSIGAGVVCAVVLTSENADDIDATLRLIAALGVKRIMVNRFNVGGAGVANRKLLLLTGDQLRSAYRRVNGTAEELELSISANVGTPHCVVNPRDYPYIHFTSCGASVDAMPLVLEPTGNIRLCNHSPVTLGNIYDENIAVILSKPYLTRFFSCIPDICVTCSAFQRCRGGCKAVSEQLGISLEDHDPISSAVLRSKS